jgi:hypothetical protein
MAGEDCGKDWDDCEKAFRAWYWEHGDHWNSEHVAPVWRAAWNAAHGVAVSENAPA